MYTLTDYAQDAAVYQRADGLPWAAVGLAGEAGEVCSEVKKYLTQDGGTLTEQRKALLALELGDTLWFLATLCRELGVPLETFAKMNIDKLRVRYAGELQ